MSNTDQTIQDIYHKIVSPLSLRDRIQLAALILNDLTEKNIEVIDSSDSWTEQDQLELSTIL